MSVRAILALAGAMLVPIATAAAPVPNSTVPPGRSAANQGDNCTPFGGFAIGYSLETEPNYRAGRIVNQSVVLARKGDGLKILGWLLTTFAGDQWFTPRNIGTLPSTIDRLPGGSARAAGLAKLTHTRASSTVIVRCFARSWSPP
jgi:hypothetical protein